MLNDEVKLYEENKKLREEIKKIKKGFVSLDWQYSVLLEFIDSKGLTDEAAEYIAKSFKEMVESQKAEATSDNETQYKVA